MDNCLPKYHFFVLDDFGWNFRYGKFHEENRRTLTKAYGIKFILNVSGRGGKFDLTNTIIILGNCFGLIGLANIAYDFIVLHGSSELRSQILDQKYETVDETDTKKLLRHSMMAMTSIGVIPDQNEEKLREDERLKAEEVEIRRVSMEIFKRYGATILLQHLMPDEYTVEEEKKESCLSESIGRFERLI